MARPQKRAKLVNVGLRIEPELKEAIDRESAALGIDTGTYVRQIVALGWQARSQLPVARNPRERALLSLFNELSAEQQENMIAIAETFHARQSPVRTNKLPKPVTVQYLDEEPSDEVLHENAKHLP